MIPSSNTPYITAVTNTPCNNSMTLHYYTSIGDDSGIWGRLNARIGYYSMTNAIFQTAILHRLYLSQPLIPAGMTCTCAGHPPIDTVGHPPSLAVPSTMTGAFKICTEMPLPEQSVKIAITSILPTKKKVADLTSLFSMPHIK
jgi:hypothetical protein